MLLFELFDGLFGESVLAQGTHCYRVESELSGVECEVGWCAAEFLSFGQHVPKCLSQTYYIS